MSENATREYEIMLLLSPSLSEDDAKKAVTSLKDEITSAGGEISFDDFWGKRKLAYSIEKEEYGYYHVLIFTVQPSFLEGFEKDLLLNKKVLRYLLSLTPKNYTPITGAQVEANEDAYYSEMRAKKTAGKKRSPRNKSSETLTESDESEEGTKEARAKKLDKILSDDLNI